MQTELKREWLRQLLGVCSGLLKDENTYLQELINHMDENHTVRIDEEDDRIVELIKRGFVKFIKDSDDLIILPQYLTVGKDLSGIGLELTVKLYDDEIVVNKGYRKFKALPNDSLS